MSISRREFIGLLGTALLAQRGLAQDWETESRTTERIRLSLEAAFAGLNMALDFRALDADQNELFRIQIEADRLFPVASCFKAFVVPYYFLNTPREEWDYGERSLLYSMTVHSSNGATGFVLDEVAQRVVGRGNAIEKFNNFLAHIGLRNGLHSWNWEGSPTSGNHDVRFQPSGINGRVVRVRGQFFQVDNAFTAADLARGHDYITRGEFFTPHADLREVLHLTKELLAIPSESTGYLSPIERVFPAGYTGKDGILPASDILTGRVVNDAGVLQVGAHTFVLAFMSAGESESLAMNILGQVINQIDEFERATGGTRLQELFDGT